MSVTVLAPGLYSLLVGKGRPHFRSLGIPLGGAADPISLALGNALIGNSPELSALEITMLGPTLSFNDPTACVVFGSDFNLKSSLGLHREAGTTFTAEPGEVLTIGGCESGVRGYFCVRGGFDSPKLLDSSSAISPIQAGQTLQCQPSVTNNRSYSCTATSKGESLRVLPGTQRAWFGPDFYSNRYTVSSASNRMGIRLLGDPIPRRAGELVSEAVAPGAVQITNDGLPIILGVDGQTIGGYPKVAHVIAADLHKLGQLRPGSVVTFEEVTYCEAELAWITLQKWLQEWVVRARLSSS
jgi:5-oxoprolinase (ATP-hydrolysing) subunit C